MACPGECAPENVCSAAVGGNTLHAFKSVLSRMYFQSKSHWFLSELPVFESEVMKFLSIISLLSISLFSGCLVMPLFLFSLFLYDLMIPCNVWLILLSLLFLCLQWVVALWLPRDLHETSYNILFWAGNNFTSNVYLPFPLPHFAFFISNFTSFSIIY